MGPRITFRWVSSTVLEYSWKSTEKKKGSSLFSRAPHAWVHGPLNGLRDDLSVSSFPFFLAPRDRKKHSGRSIRILKISVARIPTHANPYAKLLLPFNLLTLSNHFSFHYFSSLFSLSSLIIPFAIELSQIAWIKHPGSNTGGFGLQPKFGIRVIACA